MEILSNCPICDGEKINPILEVTDYSISKEKFTISSCSTCSFLFTNPRPERENISKYYESSDYISHSNSKTGLINKIYQFVRRHLLNKKIKLVSKYLDSDNSILDIGCGTGEFLNACKKQGWLTKGVEPNENARKFCLDNYNLGVVDESEIGTFLPKSFSVITMWHVLEHVHGLKKRVEDLSFLLKNNGIAIIAVPNRESFDAVYYEKYWAAYDIPRHLYHFASENIKDLFKQNDFEHIESLPMKFDSFYVSILSEKYKNNKFQFLNAFRIGLKSNLIAGKNQEKYSSVIYVFRKIS